MKFNLAVFPAIGLPALALAICVSTPSMALTAQECSAKYNAAKAAGTLGDVKWNDFRKAQCGDLAEAAKTPVATAVVFPKAVDPKYASEKAGVARRKTCSDQYKANKANNGNAGLKWIVKGGGYYSQCNKILKG